MRGHAPRNAFNGRTDLKASCPFEYWLRHRKLKINTSSFLCFVKTVRLAQASWLPYGQWVHAKSLWDSITLGVLKANTSHVFLITKVPLWKWNAITAVRAMQSEAKCLLCVEHAKNDNNLYWNLHHWRQRRNGWAEISYSQSSYVNRW